MSFVAIKEWGIRNRWLGIALGVFLFAQWVVATRYSFRDCRRSGCIVVNRWTGSVRWVEATVPRAPAADAVAEYLRTYGPPVSVDSLLRHDTATTNPCADYQRTYGRSAPSTIDTMPRPAA
jgi:hypothetical protein